MYLETGLVKNCSRCGVQINCFAQDIVKCPCNNIFLSERAKSLLSATSFDCLCNDCLIHYEHLASNASKLNHGTWKEGHHYYIEDGFMVYTELYHASRGYCCQSGCRHCVYGFKH